MLRSWQRHVSKKGTAFAPQSCPSELCISKCCPVQATEVVEMGRSSQLLRLQLCVALPWQTARKDRSRPFLSAEAFQSRWKGTPIKICATYDSFKKCVNKRACRIALAVCFRNRNSSQRQSRVKFSKPVQILYLNQLKVKLTFFRITLSHLRFSRMFMQNVCIYIMFMDNLLCMLLYSLPLKQVVHRRKYS